MMGSFDIWHWVVLLLLVFLVGLVWFFIWTVKKFIDKK